MFDKKTVAALTARAEDPRAVGGTIIEVGGETKIVFPAIGQHERVEIPVKETKRRKVEDAGTGER